MGVPAFFRKLKKKYPNIICNNPDKPIKALYIDANCLFHPQCFKVLHMYPYLKDKRKLFKLMSRRIIKYIDYLIRLTNPEELVYIAVDGVAPLAKINQQRMRRFGYVHNYKQDIYKKYNIPHNESWSNIVITPGTKFMYELHKKIKEYYQNFTKNNKDPKCKFEIIYNSYMTPGEGEHKILQHIKLFTNPNEKRATVVYGLDADLIFLSMASQCPNMYLLREADQFKKVEDESKEDIKSIEEELCFADIDCVKESINDEFNKYYHELLKVEHQELYDEKEDLINEENILNVDEHKLKVDFTNDYIFICYFLGNDFLPHLPSIDIKIGGLETIYEAYMNIFQKLGENLITINRGKVNINHEFLLEFIFDLAFREENYFCDILPQHLKRQFRRRCFETEPYKREIWNIENLKNVRIDDSIQLGKGDINEWKYRYYHHYFQTEEHMKETVDDICQNYFEGLVWVAKYYFESCPAWRWQYRYTHAPFLSDLYEYLKRKNIMKSFDVDNSKPINMYTQLVSVIPATYSYILPKKLQYLSCSNKSPIIDMYPSVYKLDMIYKTQLYKCIPIIPYLDLNRVILAVENIQLEKNEYNRSKKLKVFNLGKC